MIQKLRHIILSCVLALAPIAGLIAMPGVAHAAGGTFTWTGAGTDGNWGTAANWAGSAAPQSGDTGVTIIINNAATLTNGSIDNISNLSLASLQFENNSGGGTEGVRLAQNLTITGSITQLSSDTSTTDYIYNNGSTQTISLNGNVTVTSTAGLTFGDSTPDTLAVGNADTLTFTDASVPNIVIIDDNITGTDATVVYDGSETNYQLNGDNTYAGTTNVESTFTAPGVEVLDTDPFGTSTVNISTTGMVDFAENITGLTNTVNITGTTSGTPNESLYFNDLLAAGTFAIPHIVLNGDTLFANDAGPATTVDLAGISADGYCVQYNGSGGVGTDAADNSFANGPTACGTSADGGSGVTGAPGTPDTGLALVAAHPVTSLAASLIAALSLAVIARRLKPVKQR